MRKSLVLISQATAFLIALPSSVYAVEGQGVGAIGCPVDSQFKGLCDLSASTFGTTLGKVITFAFIGAIVIALAFLIYGGIKWIVSGGDKTAVEEARNHVVSAVVGLVIVFLSFFIINLVVYLFTGRALNDIVLPHL